MSGTAEALHDSRPELEVFVSEMAYERLAEMMTHWDEARRLDAERSKRRKPLRDPGAVAGPGSPINQHYIPRFWLTGFAKPSNKSGKVTVIDGSGSKPPETISTKRAASEANFYTLATASDEHTVALEEALGRLESDAAPTFKRMAEGHLPDQWLRRSDVSFLLAAQLMRAPETLRRVQQSMSALGRQIIEMGQQKGEVPPIPGGFEVEADRQAAMEVLWENEALSECAFYLFCRRWSLVRATDSSWGFVLPERPVVMHSGPRGGPYGTGGALTAHEVWIPVSRRFLLLMHWTERRDGTELELSGERLRDINAYMAHLDGPMVFCCPSDAEAVIEMLAAACAAEDSALESPASKRSLRLPPGT